MARARSSGRYSALRGRYLDIVLLRYSVNRRVIIEIQLHTLCRALATMATMHSSAATAAMTAPSASRSIRSIEELGSVRGLVFRE